MGLRADSARSQRVSGSARTDSQRAESACNPIAANVKFGDDSALSAFTRTQWTAAFISLEPKTRLTGGLLWWVSPSLLPCMGPMPNHASTHCGTWRVLPGGMSQMFRLLFLGNGWADCVEIWHAVGDPLATAYAVITGGISLHVPTCRDTPTPRFCISETARSIVFKFGMWVAGH